MGHELSDLAVRAAKPRERAYRLFDQTVAGLWLDVRPTGAKCWRLRWRNHKGEQLMTLGRFPDLSLAAAREKARAARAKVATGRSPLARDQESFEAIAREMIGRKKNWSEPYRARFLGYFERDVFPQIGAMPIEDVTARDCLAVMRAVEKRSPVAARHLRGRMGAVFRYSIINYDAKNDPTLALRGAIEVAPTKHKKPLNITQYMAAARAYNNPVIAAALELLLLLACRPGELRYMEWSEIDLKGAVWRIPASKMKMRRPHTVPLSKRAVAILKKLPNAHLYVFPSYLKNSDGPISKDTLEKAMKSARIMNVDGELGSPHAVRSTFSTWAHSNGHDQHIIDAVLAHKDPNAVRASYNAATYLPQRRELAEAWARYCESEARRKT